MRHELGAVSVNVELKAMGPIRSLRETDPGKWKEGKAQDEPRSASL